MNRLRQIARVFIPFQVFDDTLDSSQPLSARLTGLALSITFILALLSFLTKKNAGLSAIFMHTALILFGFIFFCMIIWVMIALFKSARSSTKASEKIPQYILFTVSTILIVSFITMVTISIATGQ